MNNAQTAKYKEAEVLKNKRIIWTLLTLMLLSTQISYVLDNSHAIYARSNDASRGYGIETDEGIVFSSFDLGKTVLVTPEGEQTIMDVQTIPFAYEMGHYLYWSDLTSNTIHGDLEYLPKWYLEKQTIDLPIAYLEDMVRDERTISDGQLFFTSSIDAYSGERSWSHKYGAIQPLDGTWIIATDGTSAERIDEVSAISGFYQNKLYYETFDGVSDGVSEGSTKSYNLESQTSVPDVQFRWVVNGKILGTDLDASLGGTVGFVNEATIIYFKEGTWRFENYNDETK